jgi:hypothetical protein
MADDSIQGNYFSQLRWDFISSSKKKKRQVKFFTHITGSSVTNPDPDVFGPPRSGSVCARYGSRSFYHQGKP